MSLPLQRTSVGDYLDLDARSGERLELLNGVVVAMAGASPRHNQVVTNLVRLLSDALEGCFVFSQDQRVLVAATESYLYPDVVVVCDAPDFDTSARPASLRNPTLVVEVLSESTQDHDLGAKLGHYRQLPSVQQVLFVHADRRAVTLVSRQEDGWKLVDRGPDGAVDAGGATLPLDALYARVDELPA
ncbi:MAG TPA: Uma2 family endonuclease [Polyangiaceae bacterium LLY-WYZ-15_(1-7)]|nr:Uma2 family endonuclease [Polyangiaceae bacterium LLY-WYZ-15_(1-7)]HJL03508.1 Uma2 family endonuclease [Polyangiaceae bacterium LLY-WYZ-15_(1-7)]HJL12768.1 Uma2 family endonuclease [Polyangiaceae bacterium LLY-WYZ-15_(1-7)]HJL22351.1 Uma2 family endonuclease [Polyangiaceae bacterium LLY-WYZ-15_(1-7)]HJL32540.1 Uma2 family endonuclease [Polyangiaceae bacterium LLY-WYZ-15_(1-7)]